MWNSRAQRICRSLTPAEASAMRLAPRLVASPRIAASSAGARRTPSPVRRWVNQWVKPVQAIDLGQEIGDVDLWHAVEDQPFRRVDLRLWHFGAVFRDGQDAIDQADSGQLASPGPIAQLL